MSRLLLNAAYAARSDGTGAWTDCLLSLDFEWQPVYAPFDPTREKRWAFYRKLVYETAFQRRSATLRVHPYAACAFDRKAALVVLDAIGAGGGSDWLAALLRRTIKRADRVATLSRDQSRRLEAIHGRSFTVLTPFPESSFFERPRSTRSRRVTPQEGEPVRVGYWGGWHPRKSVQAALETVVPGRSIRFVVTGDAPDEVVRRPDVEAVGRMDRPALIETIDACDVAIYPSRDEGFGLPPYEALLRGLPVVTRDLPCYNEFLVDVPQNVFRFKDDGEFPEALSRACERARKISMTEFSTRTDLQTATLDAAKDKLKAQLDVWLNL